VNPRAGVDDLEKIKFFTLPGLELRTLGRPVRSQSLSRLLFNAVQSGKINRKDTASISWAEEYANPETRKNKAAS
jgi:hypothetical protein